MFPKILIVYKESSYQEHALDEKDRNYLRLLREESFVLRKSKEVHITHVSTLERIKNHLKHLKIPYEVCLRYHLKPLRDFDLVMTIGGDGTFLETSHYLEKGLLMGINSVPEESIGYFCRTNADTFPGKFSEFLNKKSKTQTLHRLEMFVDGKKTGPLALNDILFANINPAGTTRYLLKISKTRLEEEQKSSGIWISPAPGSTAATKSAGGQKLPLNSNKFQFVVREPYAPPGKKYQLLKKVLTPPAHLEICSMMDDASVYIDGPHVPIPIKRGSRILIRGANSPIKVIW